MITKNFKNFIALIFEFGNSYGLIQGKDVTGTDYYIKTYLSNSYPGSVETNVVFNYNSSGIQLGSGNVTPTENDYTLPNLITSGLSGSVAKSSSNDGDGNPCISYVITLTNTTANDITIKEVGYVQTLMCATTPTGSSLNRRFLLDHTLLDSPLTVPANGTAVLKYTLKTIIS